MVPAGPVSLGLWRAATLGLWRAPSLHRWIAASATPLWRHAHVHDHPQLGFSGIPNRLPVEELASMREIISIHIGRYR